MPRRLITCVGIFCLVFCGVVVLRAGQGKGESEAAVAKTLQDVEQAWLNAEKNHDTAAFGRIVADDWIAIGPDGKSQTKAERAAEIQSAHIESASLGNVKVRVFGNAAVVTGTDEEVSVTDGKKSTGHYVWTDVFVKRDGKWVAVASQTAEIK